MIKTSTKRTKITKKNIRSSQKQGGGSERRQ